MNKTLIIIMREFTTRVTKKSFIILTILMPFLFAALVAVPILLGKIGDGEQKQVVIIDNTREYAPLFRSNESYLYLHDTQMREAYKADTAKVEAVVQIKGRLSTTPNAVTIYSAREVQADLKRNIEMILGDQWRKEKLSAYNIPQLSAIVEDMQQEFVVSTMKWTTDGKESFSSSDIAVAAGFLFTFLIYMFVMAYGGMVMQGVLEEKTNRIMEIMVSSVTPFQLMMGKIIGVALVGFTQILIWGAMFSAILMGASALFTGGNLLSNPDALSATVAAPNAAALAQAAAGGNNEMLTALLNLPFLEMGVMFVLYFIGGYLLFASFFAAVGASVNSQEDSSQFTMPVIIFLVFGMYAAMGSSENTNGPLAFWTSLIPFTSPIVMMVRIPLGVPLWQELLSLAILYATAIFTVWIASKIYRVGILMYGKKPMIKEMLKWIKYK